jgi:hypothetical protein
MASACCRFTRQHRTRTVRQQLLPAALQLLLCGLLALACTTISLTLARRTHSNSTSLRSSCSSFPAPMSSRALLWITASSHEIAECLQHFRLPGSSGSDAAATAAAATAVHAVLSRWGPPGQCLLLSRSATSLRAACSTTTAAIVGRRRKGLQVPQHLPTTTQA